MEIARILFIGKSNILKRKIVYSNLDKLEKYKKCIKRLKKEGYGIITIPEYDEEVVRYAKNNNIIVEKSDEYIPLYFENLIKEEFNNKGPLNLGVLFYQEDARMVENMIINVAKYCRFLTIPNYPRCRRISDKILKNNGLQINLLNTIEKINKKCDIIFNVKNLELIKLCM